MKRLQLIAATALAIEVARQIPAIAKKLTGKPVTLKQIDNPPQIASCVGAFNNALQDRIWQAVEQKFPRLVNRRFRTALRPRDGR